MAGSRPPGLKSRCGESELVEKGAYCDRPGYFLSEAQVPSLFVLRHVGLLCKPSAVKRLKPPAEIPVEQGELRTGIAGHLHAGRHAITPVFCFHSDFRIRSISSSITGALSGPGR